MAELEWKKGEKFRDYERRMEDDAQAAFLLEYVNKKQIRKRKRLLCVFKRKG